MASSSLLTLLPLRPDPIRLWAKHISTVTSCTVSSYREVLRSSLSKQWNNKLSCTSSTLLRRSTSRTPQAPIRPATLYPFKPRGWKGLFWRDGIKTIQLHFLCSILKNWGYKIEYAFKQPIHYDPWDGSRFDLNFSKKLYRQCFIVLNFALYFSNRIL